MTTIDIAEWSGFATAMAGASAALTGLLFEGIHSRKPHHDYTTRVVWTLVAGIALEADASNALAWPRS